MRLHAAQHRCCQRVVLADSLDAVALYRSFAHAVWRVCLAKKHGKRKPNANGKVVILARIPFGLRRFFNPYTFFLNRNTSTHSIEIYAAKSQQEPAFQNPIK